ncbi:MAG TPA: hypothetical protein DEB39_12835, partial [Planctomycetaceae bacterium]|nr:hypothetical protein [Planctomycetaceae bacterium]
MKWENLHFDFLERIVSNQLGINRNHEIRADLCPYRSPVSYQVNIVDFLTTSRLFIGFSSGETSPRYGADVGRGNGTRRGRSVGVGMARDDRCQVSPTLRPGRRLAVFPRRSPGRDWGQNRASGRGTSPEGRSVKKAAFLFAQSCSHGGGERPEDIPYQRVSASVFSEKPSRTKKPMRGAFEAVF